MGTAQQIQVIEITIKRKGKGHSNDPIRMITQYWSPSGNLLAEVDPIDPFKCALEEIAEILSRACDDKMDISHNGSTMQLLRKLTGMDYPA